MGYSNVLCGEETIEGYVRVNYGERAEVSFGRTLDALRYSVALIRGLLGLRTVKQQIVANTTTNLKFEARRTAGGIGSVINADQERARSESGTDRAKVGSVGTHNGLIYGLLYILRGDYDATFIVDIRLRCARFRGDLSYVVRVNAHKYGL